MRSTIDIDDKLLKEAQALTKITTKKELVNTGLEELIRIKRIGRLIKRLGRFPLNLSLKTLNKMRKDEYPSIT